jgi:hypothetical protein
MNGTGASASTENFTLPQWHEPCKCIPNSFDCVNERWRAREGFARARDRRVWTAAQGADGDASRQPVAALFESRKVMQARSYIRAACRPIDTCLSSAPNVFSISNSGGCMRTLSVFGERSLTVVAAAFDDRRHAESAADDLRRKIDNIGHVAVVSPDDTEVARKMEPEQRGIWRTLLRSHLILGIAGVLAGLLVAIGLVIAPWPAAADSPGLTALFAGTLGGFLGMMAGGLVTLRPDHGAVIRSMRGKLKHGQWGVVARPTSEASAERAVAALASAGGDPVRSL